MRTRLAHTGSRFKQREDRNILYSFWVQLAGVWVRVFADCLVLEARRWMAVLTTHADFRRELELESNLRSSLGLRRTEKDGVGI